MLLKFEQNNYIDVVLTSDHAMTFSLYFFAYFISLGNMRVCFVVCIYALCMSIYFISMFGS